jgi:hypothetical protein
MKLNKHFKDLTLNQYIKIVDLETNEQPTEERAYKKLAIAYNSSVDVIKQLPKPELNTALARLNKPTTLPFNNYLLLDSNLLKATTQLNVMCPAQLVDFYNLYKKGAKYNELLAVMYVPFKGGYNPNIHYKISKKLLDIKVDKVLGLLFFWMDYFKKCEKIITTYLEKQTTIINQTIVEIQNDKEFQHFLQTGGGNTM